jgi:hypothetical protein
MTRATLALAFPLLFAACSSDPCDGKGPMCISVRVVGGVPALDRIDLTASINGGARLSASNAQAPISLPVRFAVILPADTHGSVALGVDGVAAGAIVATGAGAVTVPPSGQKITITLAPGGGHHGDLGGTDGGGTDMAGTDMAGTDMAGTDGGGGDMACTPSVVCAATDCGRVADPGGCGMIDCGACQALSIDKPLALGGDTITIEGKFHGTTTVSFPGSAAPVVPATVGPARLTVVVPSDATQGLLHVTSNGSTTAGVLFHRALYTPLIGTFNLDYEQTELARGGPDFGPRSGFTLTRVGNFVYAVAGVRLGPGPVTDLDTVDRLLINADGTLAASSSTNKLQTTRGGHAALAIGDRLFILGGSNPNVETAQVGADGTLGPFSYTGVMLPSTLLAAAVVGHFVYAFGGADMNGVAQSTVQRANINTDGTLGAFATVASPLVAPLKATAACVRGGRVYVFGGLDATNMATSNVLSAPINPDGSLGGFVSIGNLLQPRSGGQCLTLDSLAPAIYIYGGTATNGTPITTVEKASVSPTDGSITGYTTQTAALGVPSNGVRSVMVGSTLYVGGGTRPNGFANGLLEHASLDGSGNLGTFAQTTVVQTTPRFFHAAAVIGNWLYLVGGDPGPPGGTHALLGSVERAPIAADGTLGTFTDLGPTVKLKTPRAGHVLAIAGGYLYVLGGETDTAGTATTSVERAAIDPVTGSIGTFDFFTDGAASNIVLSSPRLAPAAWISSGVLYVAGGHGTSAAQLSIDQASFMSDGTLFGQFAAASFDLAVAREQFRVAQLGSNTFALGGLETTGPSANVYTSMSGATFATAGALLGAARADFAQTLVGDELYVIGGRDSAPIASIVRSAVSSANGLGAFGAQGSLPTPVSQAATASAGDWFYILGGVDGSGARAAILGGARN